METSRVDGVSSREGPGTPQSTVRVEPREHDVRGRLQRSAQKDVDRRAREVSGDRFQEDVYCSCQQHSQDYCRNTLCKVRKGRERLERADGHGHGARREGAGEDALPV